MNSNSRRPGRLLLAGGAAACLAATAAIEAETISYSYDARGRLVKVVRTDSAQNKVTTEYAHDKADNRTLRSSSGATVPSVPSSSFELPEVGSGFAYNPHVAGASFVGLSGIAGNGSAWGFAPAPDGDQVAFIQGSPSSNGSISHSVTGLVAGRTYRVTFRLAQRPGFGINPVTVAINGASLGTFTPQSTAFASFASATFVAGAATASLSFTGQTSSGDSGTGLDLVAIGPP